MKISLCVFRLLILILQLKLIHKSIKQKEKGEHGIQFSSVRTGLSLNFGRQNPKTTEGLRPIHFDENFPVCFQTLNSYFTVKTHSQIE